MSEGIQNITLPLGWKAEAVPHYKDFILISAANNAGMVTVDLKDRVFRLGYTTRGRVDTRTVHEGRGWKKALIADAVASLEAALA